MNSNTKILENLFGGKAKSRIIKVFLHCPHLSLTIESLAKRTGLKTGECKRVVKDLERIGVLKKANNNRSKKSKVKIQKAKLKFKI